MKLTIDYIQEKSSARSFIRGEEYYEMGSVKKLTCKDSVFSAVVSGTNYYNVKVICKDEGFLFNCSCPYDFGGICKHSVAVGLAIVNGDYQEVRPTKNKAKRSNTIEELLQMATAGEAKTFLKKILEKSDVYVDEFEAYLKGQTGVEKRLNISEIRDELIAALENFDLENYQRFYDNDNDYGYYREEWEVLYDGAREELEEIMDIYLDDSMAKLERGNIIDAFKIMLACYEAISMFDVTKINDELEIFDSIVNECFEYWGKTFDTYEKELSKIEIQPDAGFRMIDIFFDRTKQTESEDFYSIDMFQPVFLQLITNKEVAEKCLTALKKYGYDDEDSDEIQLKIASFLGNEKEWEAMADKYHADNPNIARQLLDYYKKKNATEKYLKIAKTAFRGWPNEFDEEIYSYLKSKPKSDFQADVLIHYTIRTESINLFKELKKQFGDEKILKLLNELKSYYAKDSFYISVLTELQDYKTILEYLEEHINSPYIDFMVKPIINIYPQQCFELIKKKTENFLKENIGRKYYQDAVGWLRLLMDIRDDSVKSMVNNFIFTLREKYYNRPALKDEMRKMGLN